MNKFIITTDATCDIPKELVDKDFYIMPMEYILDGKVYTFGNPDSPDSSWFFDQLKNGKLASTSQITPIFAEEFLRPYLKEGYDVLNISFSGNLSATADNLAKACENLSKEFPNNKVYSIDSKTTTMGLGVLCAVAIDARKNGKTIDETFELIKNLIIRLNTYFTVDDLMHLYRGGRLSKGNAIAGTIMRIKPVLYVSPEGKLRNIEKVMSKKLVYKRIAEIVQNQSTNDTNSFVIAHGNNEEGANQLATKIVELTGIEKYYILPMSPIIGSHTGQGVLAVSFIGKDNYEIKSAD